MIVLCRAASASCMEWRIGTATGQSGPANAQRDGEPMTASIQLSNGDRLEIDAYREALRLTSAIGGAKIELGLTVARVPAPPTTNPSPNVVPAAEQRHRVTAALYVSTRLPQQDRRYLLSDGGRAPGNRR